MKKRYIACAIAGAFAAAGPAAAQVLAQSSSTPADNPPVVITASPLGSGLFDLAVPADVLAGRRLLWQRKGSLGETLDALPGISATYFGPFASRPVIRGLDGDRIRILQNSGAMQDASSLSFDHAVPYDPLVADRIEIVRGPAAVLYGGNATGGVVNLIDNRIPSSPIIGLSGRVEPRFGGAERERSTGAVLEAGNGSLALHVDVFDRRTQDVKIPGFARSSRQRGLDAATVVQGRDTLANSSADASGGAIGGSVTWGNGHVGLSFGDYRSNYGSIPEPAVRIDMKSERWDLGGEARELGSVVSAVKFKLSRSDYRHHEIDAGTIATTFLNKSSEGRLEVTHGKLGPLTGTVGMNVQDMDFSALGAEAFVPRTNTRSRGLFIYEEMPLGSWKFSGGLRGDGNRVSSEGGGAVDASTGQPRFDPPQSRDFRTGSSALGVLYSLTKTLSIAGNLTRTERAPTQFELYANGPHAATGVYEVGNSAFAKERSKGWDLGLRWRSGAHSASVGVYRTRFANFITLFGTGRNRGADGELDPVDADEDGTADGSGEEIAPEFAFRAVPAVFRGMEAQARFRVYERIGALDVDLKADSVNATDRTTGAPLPRIAPRRLGLGLEYTRGQFTGRFELHRVSAQGRVAATELPTDAYTLANLVLAWNMKFDRGSLQAFARVNNLTDAEARNHTSLLKDQAPLPGRGLVVGLRGAF